MSIERRLRVKFLISSIGVQRTARPTCHVHSLFAGRARHSVRAGRELLSSLSLTRWVMFPAGSEHNRHGKRDDGAEANPPGEFHYRQPARLRVQPAAEQAGNLVW